MNDTSDRKPKNYSGTSVTSRPIQAVFPKVLEKLSSRFRERPDLVLKAWPEVVGARLAPMARAYSFTSGILVVKVSNSTLFSLLAGPEKRNLLIRMRKLFPKVEIKDILFKMG